MFNIPDYKEKYSTELPIVYSFKDMIDIWDIDPNTIFISKKETEVMGSNHVRMVIMQHGLICVIMYNLTPHYYDNNVIPCASNIFSHFLYDEYVIFDGTINRKNISIY